MNPNRNDQTRTASAKKQVIYMTTIKVVAEDIQNSEFMDSTDGAIARAVNRKIKTEYESSVCSAGFLIHTKEVKSLIYIKIPDEKGTWMYMYKNKEGYSFDVEIPQEYLST